MKKNVKKIKFKNKDILKEDAADTFAKGVGELAGDVKKVFSVFGNSFLRMFKIVVSYPKDLLMAKFVYKTSLRDVHLKHAQLQRTLYRKNQATLDSMSGAKDLNSFLTVVSPSIKSFEVFMNTTPVIGEKLDQLSTDSRENWNRAVDKIYDGNPPDFLVLDTGGSLREEKEGTLLIAFIKLLKLVYTKKFAEYIDLRNLTGLDEKEQNKLIIKFEKNIDKDRRKKITSLIKNYSNDDFKKFKEGLNTALKEKFEMSDNEITFFHKIFTYDFIDTKQVILETKKDKEVLTIIEKINSIKDSELILQKLINVGKDDSKNSDDKDDSKNSDDKDDDKDEPETLTASKKIVFRKNNMLILESNEEVDKLAVVLSKSYSSQFNKMYFINIYFYSEISLINARIIALYFSFINSIINAHKSFLESGKLNIETINKTISEVTKNGETCLNQINFLENKLGDKIFKVTETLSKQDVVISKESFSKEVSQLKDYYNTIIEQIQKISNELVNNINKLIDAESSEISDESQANLIKSLNAVKAFIDATEGIGQKYQDEKQSLPEIIKSFEDESITGVLKKIYNDIDFYKEDSLSNEFITDNSLGSVGANKSKLIEIYKNYTTNDINKAIEDIKAQIESRSKDVEKVLAQNQIQDQEKTEPSDAKETSTEDETSKEETSEKED